MTPLLKPIVISGRSRFIVWLLKMFLRPWLARVIRGSDEKIGRIQLRMSAMRCPNTHGLNLQYTVVGTVPGHVLGNLGDTRQPVLLWLHGGAFILPASPVAHHEMVAKLCSRMGAVGFLPDYRLAPRNRFPAALDDCENAYAALLNLGFAPERIILGGDSAGGNLGLGVLQRVRKAQMPMPCCAVFLSPATEMGRIHAPPSRAFKMKRDPILPIASFQRVDELYAGDWDASDPELSPLFADCRGFPPLFLLVSDNEVLTDDSTLFAARAHSHGVDVRCEIWPVLPHAFPLFGAAFPEVKIALADMLEYMQQQLGRSPATGSAGVLPGLAQTHAGETPALLSAL